MSGLVIGYFLLSFSTAQLGDVVTAMSKAPATERRPLILYLHNDDSVSANVFCSQVLCNQQIADHINQNAVLWPWDFTVEENRNKWG